MKTRYLFGLLAILVLILAAIFALFPRSFVKQSEPAASIPAGHVVVHGMMACLPRKDTSGPQTLECAFGLQDDAGRYYALRDKDPEYRTISGHPMNARVEVEGDFLPQASDRYQDIGVIAVDRIDQLDVTGSTTPTVIEQ